MYFIETAELSSIQLHPARQIAHPKLPPIVWPIFVSAVAKAAFLLIDHKPGFHFGDSGAYLATALIKWIPPDRSFTYGFFVRPLVLYSHSLLPLLLVQVVMSAAAAVIVGFLLLRYFRASLRAALCFSFLCAVEPLQLMEERYVMAETAATLLFALLTWASLAFLETHRFSLLVGIQLVGIMLVSLRYSFIPLVILLSILLPLLGAVRARSKWKQFLIGLSVAVLCSQFLLFGYRHLYGFLAHTEPSYLSRGGDFLAADMAPIITPQDFPIANERAVFFKEVKIPLRDIDQRRFQRWSQDGLCAALLRVAGGDEEVANKLALKTAQRAIKRNPFGVARLAVQTYGEFLSYRKMHWALLLDQWGRMLESGEFVPAEDHDVTMIRSWFGINARYPELNSVTRRWELLAAPWCWVIVLLPLAYIAEIWIHRKQTSTKDIFLVFSALCMLLSALIPVEIANPRYLVPLPWLSVLVLGVIWTRCSRRPVVPNQP